MNDPHTSLAPNCIPFAFTNLSMYSQYLGKDKVVGFAQPMAEDVEVHALTDHDEIAEMMWGPRNHIPRKTQAKYKMPGFSTNYAKCFLPVFFHPIVHNTFRWFLCSLLVFLFLTLSCPKCALVWGNCCERLCVEIFVRVLHSSRVNLNNVINTNVFCCV